MFNRSHLRREVLTRALGPRWPESEQHADATLVGIRCPDMPAAHEASLDLESVDESSETEPTTPHRQISVVLRALLEAISKRDTGRVDDLLERLTERQLVPGRNHIEAVLERAESSRIGGARRILERLTKLRTMHGRVTGHEPAD